MVYLAPGKGELTAVSFRPEPGVQPDHLGRRAGPREGTAAAKATARATKKDDGKKSGNKERLSVGTQPAEAISPVRPPHRTMGTCP